MQQFDTFGMASPKSAETGAPQTQDAEAFNTVESASYKRWALVRAYGFSVAEFHFLLSPGIYSELIKAPSWSPLPNVGQHFSGLLNLRGNLVPVYQLGTYLDASQPIMQPAYGLLIGAPGQGAALVLEDKPQAFDYASLEVSDDCHLAPHAIAHCVKNTFRANGNVWFELSHDTLFSTMSS